MLRKEDILGNFGCNPKKKSFLRRPPYGWDWMGKTSFNFCLGGFAMLFGAACSYHINTNPRDSSYHINIDPRASPSGYPSGLGVQNLWPREILGVGDGFSNPKQFYACLTLACA